MLLTWGANAPLAHIVRAAISYHEKRRSSSSERFSVCAVVDACGALVVEYVCDAWGAPTATTMTVSASTTSTLATALSALNPFRYRGYIYDAETGLYSLRSRYYNPEWGRFMSADSLGGKVGKLFSHNVFAYCANNSVNASDPSGRMAGTIAGVIGASSWLLQNIDWNTVLESVGWAAVSVLGVEVAGQINAMANSHSRSTAQAVTYTDTRRAESGKYYFAISFFNGPVVTVGSPMDQKSAYIAIEGGLFTSMLAQGIDLEGIAGVSGYGIYTPSQSDAYALAVQCSPNISPSNVTEEISSGMAHAFWHYHPDVINGQDRRYVHIWYGLQS